MIRFVNAKINIGLSIVRKRPDGYHDLESVFYPVGLYSGTPENPQSFDDVLEINPGAMCTGLRFRQSGNPEECPPEDNLVVKAARLYLEQRPDLVHDLDITLRKHIPSQAGLGGGSADAAFTLATLADLESDFTGLKPSKRELADMALQLGADCPYFLYNRPAFVSGIGEKIKGVDLNLAGNWIIIAKPPQVVSTAKAFAGIRPKAPKFDLRNLPALPIGEWKGKVFNDFEETVFKSFPGLASIKRSLYEKGAVYASLSGSGSCLYGIWTSREEAEKAFAEFNRPATNIHYYLLKL